MLNLPDALADERLFGGLPAFHDLGSWQAWEGFVRAVYGLPNVACPRCMLQRPDLPPNVLLGFGHSLPPSGASSVQRGL